MASYVWPPSGGGGGGVDVYPSIGAFPVTAPDGTLGLASDTGILYYFESDSNSWVPIAGPGVALSVGAFDSGIPNADGAHIDANALIMQSASITDPGLVNTVAQTFAGHKTFQDGLTGTLTGHATLDEPIIPPGLVTDYWRGDKSFQPLVTSAVGAINLVGSPSFDTLDGQLDRIISSGVTDGGVLTDNANGTINIAAATAYLTTNLVVSSVTLVGNIATVTTAVAHSYITGNYIVLIGAINPEYNGLFLCTVTGPNTFTYFVSGTPTSPDPSLVMNVTSENSPVNICSVPAVLNLPLVDHITNYIYVDFNLGSPIFASTIDPSSIFGLSRVNCWTVAREGNKIWFVDNRQINLDTPNRVNRKHIQTNPFAPAINTSILSATGTRNFKVSAGGFWDGLNKTLQAAFDTSGTSSFTYASTANNGLTWTYLPGQTQIDNTRYNNVSAGLVLLTPGNYGVHWVYVMCSVPCTLIVVYGQGDYTKSQAFSSLEPTLLPNIISLTNIGITSASPGLGVLVGRIIVQDGAAVFSDTTSSFINVFPNLNPTLDSLADVQAANPNVNDVLSWNGASWVNAEVGTAVSAGAVNYFDATPVLTAVGPNNANLVTTLSPIPITSAEQTKATALTTNTLVAQAMRAANPIGRTSIDAGNWTFTQYAGVNSVAAGRVTTVTRNIYQVIPETGMTATMAGAGLTRTLVVTGGTPFVAGDANASIPLGSYVRTPLGLYKITIFTSSSQVTIAVPVGYVNEIAVTFSKWNRLFGIISPAITSISPTYNAVVFGTTQPAFPVNPTDFLGSILFGTSNNTTTLTNVYNGSTHNTNMVTPLNILHNDLLGLQGGTSGEYFHLTNSSYNDVLNAQSANTFSTIVKRDVSGNFAASTLSISGANVSGLTASQTVVTDAGKNLASLSYTDAASGSTIVSRDASGNSSFNNVTANVLNGNLGGGLKGSRPIQTGPSATNMHPVPADYGALIPDSTQADGWRTAAYNNLQNGRPGKNYIKFADLENQSLLGWSTGTITVSNGLPASPPVFVPPPNVVLSIRTLNPISGSACLLYNTSLAPAVAGNMFYSDPVTIDRSDQAQVLSFRFKYENLSGTADFSGTSANTFAIGVWDIVNNSWFPVAGQFSMVQGSGVGTAQGTFQTAINTTSIQLVVYTANGASAQSITYDDFYLGPQSPGVLGPAMSDWQSYTPTGAFTTNSTYTGKWRRVGDSIEVDATVSFTGAPNAVIANITIPPGLTIDPSKFSIPSASGSRIPVLGVGQQLRAAVVQSQLTVIYFNPTTVQFVYYGLNSGSYTQFAGVTQVLPFTIASGDIITARFSVPISGFSSNTVLSNESDTRTVAMHGTWTAAIPAATGLRDLIATSTSNASRREYDDTASYNTSNGIYTISVTGKYKFSAFVLFNGVKTAGNVIDVILTTASNVAVKDICRVSYGTIADLSATGSVEVDCKAGEQFKFRVSTADSLPIYGDATGAFGYISIERLSGPATIAASQSVNMRYSNTAGGSSITGSGNDIPYPILDYDSHNSFDGTTYRIPISGKYMVMAAFIVSLTLGTNGDVQIRIMKNGILYKRSITTGTGAGAFNVQTFDIVPCLAGDLIKIVGVSGVSTTVLGSSNYSTLSIARVGN